MNVSLYKQCTNCVLDTNDDPNITFDEKGICKYCTEYKFKAGLVNDPERGKKLEKIISAIKETGKGKKYDCLVGVSGGVDSTYVALLAKKYGLRPLIVHFDNGWNSELAVKNIENIIQKLGFDLYTYVINWEEFRDMQRAYFKADVVDIEALTDHAIYAVKHKLAKKHGIKYLISGSNVVTEGVLPPHWVHRKLDWLNIKSIHKKFGEVKLKTYPKFTFLNSFYFKWFYKAQVFTILDYVEYDKEKAKQTIITELEWKDYGGKHHESLFTKFYQAHILPEKFHIDKRRAHYSTLICSGQIKKQQALKELEKPIYDPIKLKEDKEFVLKKLGFSNEWFDAYLKRSPVSHFSYPTYTNKQWVWERKFYQLALPVVRFLRKLVGR
ncbi:MAG TPA: N-acetyl sugar amidotransferase [Bacteroidia bacterium]|jgi:N-acetyl sugar amidotransferase|nr:N-acetyl sugar amidotransferase [Bacteroidia bacterium]